MREPAPVCYLLVNRDQVLVGRVFKHERVIVQHRPYHAEAKDAQEQLTYPSVSATRWLGDGSSNKYRVCLSNAWDGSAMSCKLIVLPIPAETADCGLIYCMSISHNEQVNINLVFQSLPPGSEVGVGAW